MKYASMRRALLNTISVVMLTLIGALTHSLAWGNNSPTQTLFLKAERLAKAGQFKIDSDEAQALKDYALYPYLIYNQLNSTLTELSSEDINHFSKTFSDSHLEGLLRYRFTQHMGKKKNWDVYLSFYEGIEHPNTAMQCYFAEALFANNQITKAIEVTADLWQAGKSQPDACDSAFRLFRSAGGLTSEIALKRVLNALDANRWGLSGYALRFVKDDQYRRVADSARSVYRSPFKVINLSSELNKTHRAHLYRIAIKRAYRNDPYQALNLLLKLGDQFDLKNPDNLALLSRVGIRVAKELDHHDRQKLDQLDPSFTSKGLTEWRIRLALLERDWDSVKYLIEQLPESLIKDPRWQYWQAMVPDNRQANNQLRLLSEKRSFYGFLAALHTQQRANLNDQSLKADPLVNQSLKSSIFYQRIVELVRLDRYTVARSEWNRWIKDLTEKERRHAAHLMNEIEWYQQGILGAAYQGFWNDMDLRFPDGFRSLFDQYATKRNIDTVWAQALARQESALFPWARSSVGARGLMQLMPRTAKQTAQSIGMTYSGKQSLINPELNVRLGTAYLAQMHRQFDNRVHATAAYNAGPHRVKRWLKDRADLPLDIWIELIPFDETRTYVQNVLSFAVIYAQRRGEDRDVMTQEERARLTLALR